MAGGVGRLELDWSDDSACTPAEVLAHFHAWLFEAGVTARPEADTLHVSVLTREDGWPRVLIESSSIASLALIASAYIAESEPVA